MLIILYLITVLPVLSSCDQRKTLQASLRCV